MSVRETINSYPRSAAALIVIAVLLICIGIFRASRTGITSAPPTKVYFTTDDSSPDAAKAALFFIALEDAYGESPVRSGLAQVVALLRGKEVGFSDLRAALEQTTGKNLAEPFRVWLYSTGMPQDFRDRYSAEK